MNIRKHFLCLTFLFITSGLSASVLYNEALGSLQTCFAYLRLGFTHVIPLGFDHILFILGLFFLNSNLKSVLIQCTVFTLAHSVTLGMTVAGYIYAPSYIIEPLISLSIMIVAIENLFNQKLKSWRLITVFSFGLVHGMGFASALSGCGLSKKSFLSSLMAFNLGVEFAQVVVILIAFITVGIWFSKKDWYRQLIVYPLSMLIACIAFYWTLERLMLV